MAIVGGGRCTWEDYERFLAASGLDWSDDPSSEKLLAKGAPGELSAYITTAASLAEMLRLLLGREAYAGRTEPVTIDVIGWAFTWLERPEGEETSMTEKIHAWDAELQAATKLIWGTYIGDTLRRFLPLVRSVTIRGYGPEAPEVALTSLRDDGWLSLELHQGLYTEPSQPPPTLTLLENSGLHDGGFWPSDGGCISDRGCLCTTEGCITDRSLPVAEQRKYVGDHGSGKWSRAGVPLRCATLCGSTRAVCTIADGTLPTTTTAATGARLSSCFATPAAPCSPRATRATSIWRPS